MNEFLARLQFPFADLPNWKRLFRAFVVLFDCAANDLKMVLNAFFPYLADMKSLELHGYALSIPRFVFDSDETYRDRVAFASDFLVGIGTRKQLVSILEMLFFERYLLKEYPNDGARVGYSKTGKCFIGNYESIILKVKNLTADEERSIHQYLDFALDPDIYFKVSNWEAA